MNSIHKLSENRSSIDHGSDNKISGLKNGQKDGRGADLQRMPYNSDGVT
jgi:hypothetical protein